MNISVVIPTIPARTDQLGRALRSVQAQALPVRDVHVALDAEGRGAAHTRNRGLDLVNTEWVAFLDDDDEFKPNHLRACARHAVLTGADLVYPWWDGPDDIGMYGLPFDAALLRRRNYIPVTVLARTALVRAAGGFVDHPDENGDPCEDWGLWLKLLDAGARFSHLPQRTWIWHPGGTRGVADGAR